MGVTGFREAASRSLREHLSKVGEREYGWSGQVDRFLDEGADPNVCDDRARPALCVVAEHGYPQTVEHLINLGADLGARSPDGETALQVAARKGNEVIVASILETKRTPGVGRDDVVTALQKAFQAGHEGVVSTVLLFLDVLKTERYKVVSAVQVGNVFGIVVPESGYCLSIFTAIGAFMSDTLGWNTRLANEIRHRWDHHVQNVTRISTITVPSVLGNPVIGHALHNRYDADFGMGTENSGSGGGVYTISMTDQASAAGAAQLLQLVRAIDRKVKR